jgi:cytochrome c oxidase cbb3-type subunit IV
MAIDDLRALLTVLAFIAFIGIVVWAYSRKRKRDFEEAARLPFNGDELGGESREKDGGKGRSR